MSRILLVDDDRQFLHVLRIALEKLGHEVQQAENGKAALALCDSESFEIVVTDLIMPEKEGLETIRELRRNHPAVKVIAMSGGSRRCSFDYLKMARQLGARSTLDKPFTSEALAAAIESVRAGVSTPSAPTIPA